MDAELRIGDRVDGPLRITAGWVIAPVELGWRFSRSSGPGGQGVNTTDSRVELTWTPADSSSLAQLSEPLRVRLHEQLAHRLVNGSVVIAASEYRAQLRNREAARRRLAQLLREALAPPPRRRAATRPTRGSVERRLQAKKARSRVKAGRGRPTGD
ncbi:MAG TPA: alternative ribosome rescue aminoacyl-tRNA hydrolase ArfB [Propionibacteriaceae bacterium]